MNIMKERIRNIATYVMVALMALTFNSCEDDEIAQTLDGIWEGEVATEYFSYRHGVQTEYQAVDIEFYTDPYRYARGTGIEYDYYRSGYWYTASNFDFEVRNGVIYLDYDDGSYVAIRNYRLSDNRFRGEFIDYYSGRFLASFDFVKVSDWRHNRYTRSGSSPYKEVPSPRLQNSEKSSEQ